MVGIGAATNNDAIASLMKRVFSILAILLLAATVSLLMLREPVDPPSATIKADTAATDAPAETSTMTDATPSPSTGSAGPPATAEDVSQLPIVEALHHAGFTRFAALLNASGLAKTLADSGPHTCFAPTDPAFDQLPEHARQRISKDPSDPSVVSWLRYHFAQGEQLDSQALGLERGLWTLDGRMLTIWVTPGNIRIDKHAEIVRPDIRAADGIIHGIGAPLEFRGDPATE